MFSGFHLRMSCCYSRTFQGQTYCTELINIIYTVFFFYKNTFKWDSYSNSFLLSINSQLTTTIFSFLEPGVPESVSLISISFSGLRLSWKPPKDTNGVISGYYITWRIVRNDTNHTVDGKLITTTVNENTMSYNISGLGKCLQPLWPIAMQYVEIGFTKQDADS